ncbi:MAG: hypothetical protein GY882_01575 [Actinomycetia bacterium]|nr:hypothetical protein [Actinomycetes bacterium]
MRFRQGQRPGRDGACRGNRRIAAIVLLACSLAAPGAILAADAQSGLFGFDDLLGFGGGAAPGYVTDSTSWGVTAMDMSLHQDIHLHTGGIVGHSAVATGSVHSAIAVDLWSSNQLAFDALVLAENARAQAEAKRLQMIKDGIAFNRDANPGAPQPYELKAFGDCGHSSNSSKQARIEVVDVWAYMCADAEASGVELRISSGYRSPAYQMRIWEDALRAYGSASEAARWVARPTPSGHCTSRHCAGAAIDVSSVNGAWDWMHATIGCWSVSDLRLGTSACTSAEIPVERLQIYGYVAPMSWEPWHIEIGLPADEVAAADCLPPSHYQVPEMVAAIWRCHLLAAGIGGSTMDAVVADALLVSRCESTWDPEAVAFGGRYIDTPHPATGQIHTATGIFSIDRATADALVEGGYANAHDPVANINAAARLFLSGLDADPWAPWSCATGDDITASVLPGRNEAIEAYPDWVWSF